MITLNNLSMAFGQKLLFCDVNLILNGGRSYALVGANGTGKSTLFKLITGEEEISSGEIIIPKSSTIGWLKQDQFRYEETPIADIVLQGKPRLWDAMQEKEALFNQATFTEAEGYRFAELEEIIMQEDGYNAPGEIEAILVGLGIPSHYHTQPLKALSGGYKLRVLLAQTLFQRPSILLLDEPTNHLDILSIQWLEQFLKKEFQGLVLFISHDVAFIDQLADHILDIDYGDIRQYSGQYEKFLDEKKLLQEQKLVEKKQIQDKIEHLQRFVTRFGATASKAAQARSRVKMIEKLEVPDIINSSRVVPRFQFKPKRPSGKIVCKINQLSKAYHNKPLFEQVQLEIHRGEKIAILGANGRGKSTLVKLLLDIVTKDTGTVEWGSEIRISYFSQDHHELLNHSVSILDWLTQSVSHTTEQQIRTILGNVLFSKDDVHKDILTLSGGEAARLLLAKIMLENPNVLILDEPTNHMDLESIDVLADALTSFSGTLILVSHNRRLVDAVANRIVYLTPEKGIQQHQGSYAEWIELIP